MKRALHRGSWPEVYTRKGYEMPEWFPVYRVLRMHQGWTVADYLDAPGEYTDWALQFDRIEGEVANERAEAAQKRSRR